MTADNMPATRVTVAAGARQVLRDMAAAEGVTPRQYLEALLHYAASCHNRPGSWEAAGPFQFANYRPADPGTPGDCGGLADRWF